MKKIPLFSGLMVSLLVLLSCGSSVKNEDHPNLVIVFPDQMRGQAIGFIGQEPVKTPRLDRFAEEGVVLTQMVSNYPLCSPFRAMLMTGKYPLKNHVTDNCTNMSAKYGSELQKSDTTWSDILHAAGYSLGYIGKWHLESPHAPYIDCANNKGKVKWNEWTPPDRRHGFDYWVAYNTYDYHMNPMYWNTDAGRDDYYFVNKWGPEYEADLAVQYIKNEEGKYRDEKKPFALVVSMNPPHMPYNQVPQKYKDLYEDMDTTRLFSRPDVPPAGTRWGDYFRKNIRNYYAMITGVDEQFGRILDALKENGLEENTIVLFMSDHGNCLGIHDMISKNNPYEESMRIPFLLRWPGHLQGRMDSSLYMSVPDIYPTLMDLLGFEREIPAGVQGRSFADYLLTSRGEVPSSQLYFKIYGGSPFDGKRGVRTARYTLVLEKRNGQYTDTVLFDRQADPFEMENLAAGRPALVHRLVEEALVPALEKADDPFLNK
jgi:arylsulfatase A-like enzyme